MALNQQIAPIYEALKQHSANRIVHFDVPGHKGGRGTPDLTEFLGASALKADVNSMKPLDNLINPISVIKQAEELAAEAFDAADAFFMVGGTSSSVMAMILAACTPGDKIIMPRNVHVSALNAVIMSGAVPIFINPHFDDELCLPLCSTIDDIERAIAENRDVKAIFINNPTYYGFCADLKKIVEIAHLHGILVLADEAHGTHFYFGENLPMSAMAAGADMSAVSMHKTGGSLTQSSILLSNGKIDGNYIRQIINLNSTTSGSYLLLSSLDLARRNLALNGKNQFAKTLEMAEYARAEINKSSNFKAFGKEQINRETVYDFDLTKLAINTLTAGISGIEVYDILRDEYDIQIELGSLANILAIISNGDRMFEIERLIGALADISQKCRGKTYERPNFNYINPKMSLTPRDAFYAKKRAVNLEKSAGKISAEFVMCYPPGIPIVMPGEAITPEIIEYINECKVRGCLITGPVDANLKKIMVI